MTTMLEGLVAFWETLSADSGGWLRAALLMGVLAAVASGLTGTLVVVQRVSALAGALAHAVLAGLGGALYAQNVLGWTWLDPLLGAAAVGVGAALVLSALQRRGQERADAAISALWAVGMAVGLLFLAATPGSADPMAYLFGDILLVRPLDLWVAFGLVVALLFGLVTTYRAWQAVTFDPDFARLRGLPVGWWQTAFLVLVALAIVLLVSVVGIVLVVALLALPAATASHWGRTLARVMALAVLLCVGGVLLGLQASFATDAPTGPVIILAICAVYLVSLTGKAWQRRRRQRAAHQVG